MAETASRAAAVRVYDSVESLLARAERREPWKTADSLSGSRFERVTIDGEQYVVKYVCVDDDWIMRATGDLHCRQLTLFGSSTLDALPAGIDALVVACAAFTSPRGHRGAALLMRDVTADLIPAGDSRLDPGVHNSLLEHVAQMHAAFWGFRDHVGLFPLAHHYMLLTPAMAELEMATGAGDPVPHAVFDGWNQMAARFPAQALVLLELSSDPSPLVADLRAGPTTLLHGDLKFGNMGGDSTRTILLDWDRSGEGPPLVDLAWYLAVNCDRLPASKTDVIKSYRGLLESCGVDTSPWWDAQLRAALVGAFVQLGWSKVDDDDEFLWWAERLHEWQQEA